MINKEILVAHLNSNKCSLTETGRTLVGKPVSRQYIFQLMKKWNVVIEKRAVISKNISLDK